MIVLPTGPTDRPLLALVGEAPGVEEERLGQPFVGASGHLLTGMLSAAGIARSDCYITNVVQHRPPCNDFGVFYDDKKRTKPKQELLDARERLQQELARVRPKVIVPLGAEALKVLGGTHKITDYRGTMIERFGHRVLPTYHPAFVLRSYDTRPIVETDLRKAVRQAREPYKPWVSFTANPTFHQVMEFLARRPKRLALDIETIDMLVRCIGFAWSKNEAICIPIIAKGESRWSEGEEAQILLALDKLLRDPSVEFITQNGSFDLTVLAQDLHLHVENLYLDTMFSHHLLFPELPKGLDFLCSIYTDHPMYWDYNSGSDSSTFEYNCMDCVVTFEAAENIEKQLYERGLWDYYKRVVHSSLGPLCRAQSRGVLIDLDAKAQIVTEAEAKLAKTQAELTTILGRPLKPQSSKEVPALVYDEWKLPRQFKPKTKQLTCDEDALKILIRKYASEPQKRVLQLIIDYRQTKVLKSTFGEMKLKNGRVHTSYNPAGTVTGRISSSATIEGIGGNLQNIPRGAFRRIFRADPGKVLIKADLSQAEYRVLIWKARIRRIIDRFLSDPKFSVHMWNAAENIYQVPYSQVTKKMYDEAKNGVYGANYNIGHIKVSRMYDIELDKARFILTRYHAAVPEIREVYQAEIEAELRATRTLRNPFGRERIFMGRMDDELLRQGYSHYCQSTVADVIFLGLIALDNAEAEVLLQVHDELVVQCPIAAVAETAAFVRSSMSVPIVFPGVPEPLTIPVELKVGPDWFNMKPLDEYLKEPPQ